MNVYRYIRISVATDIVTVVSSDHAYSGCDCSGFIVIHWNIVEAVDGFEEHPQAYTYVTQYEKTGLMYTKYSYPYYGTYFLHCIILSKSAICISFSIESCIYCKKFGKITMFE